MKKSPLLKMRSKFKSFIFEGFKYEFIEAEEELIIKLNYSLDSREKFEEILTLKVTLAEWKKVNLTALEKALEGLFLIGGISYYKTFCPPKIVQKVVPMNQAQAKFWQKLYERGLGEFFYQNQLDFRGLIKFEPTVDKVEGAIAVHLRERALLPLGGGKDSIVSAELLKKFGLDFITISLRDAKPIKDTAEVIGKNRILIDRMIAPRLMELNEAGALNGHVPITAFISFLLVVSAIVYDYKFLVLSLEKSANFGQLEFFGQDINHQYSKSEEFEGDFRNYVSRYICPEVEYFSLLRGFYELRIVELFARLKNLDEYLPVFTSCNTNFKIVKNKPATLWCGKCPKCAFVFLCLAAFLERRKLLKVFGKNLLDSPELINVYEELLGVKNFKPFECVGTPEECRAALWLINQKAEYRDDAVVAYLRDKYLSKWDINAASLAKIMTIQPGHFIPTFLLKKINQLPA